MEYPPKLDEDCTVGYKSYQGQCYKLSNEAESWETTQSKCTLDGGSLIAVTNVYEQSFVESLWDFNLGPLWVGMVFISFLRVSLSESNITVCDCFKIFNICSVILHIQEKCFAQDNSSMNAVPGDLSRDARFQIIDAYYKIKADSYIKLTDSRC